MKKYFVTGVAGFIGARTAELLLEAGHFVLGIDNMNDYYDVALKEHRLEKLKQYEHFEFQNRSLEDKNGIHEVIGSNTGEVWDAVFHLAARAGVRYSLDNPEVYFQTNVMGLLNILESMKAFSVKKLVLASTSSLYAGQEMPFVESLPVNTPISPYSASKKAAEVLAYTYHYLYGIDVAVVRYFTVYGPAGRPDMSPYRFIQWIDEGKPLKLFGDGEQCRDFTYIDDIARGTILAAKDVGYEVINLGGGNNPLSINRMIHILEGYLGKKAKIEFCAPDKSDMESTWADISKANRLLNWTPEVSPEEGFRKTVDWHLKHKSFLSSLPF